MRVPTGIILRPPVQYLALLGGLVKLDIRDAFKGVLLREDFFPGILERCGSQRSVLDIFWKIVLLLGKIEECNDVVPHVVLARGFAFKRLEPGIDFCYRDGKDFPGERLGNTPNMSIYITNLASSVSAHLLLFEHVMLKNLRGFDSELQFLVLPEVSGEKSLVKTEVLGAPIRRGLASPLRVATGGATNCGSGARPRRSPAPANGTARDWFWTGWGGCF